MNIAPGTVIAGNYQTARKLGSGGMGEVWAAHRMSDGQEVALKILLPSSVANNEVLARFRREANVLARIRSEYVSQVLDFSTDPAFGFVLVMELIPGESLYTILTRDGQLPLETVIDIADDVLHGLRDLHAANVVHRDLKPGNIVLLPGTQVRDRAILIDFGVSRIMTAPHEEEVTAITRGDRVLGTLEYMAPEQILGSRTVTGIADLYALGAIMYRAIAGHHAFRGLAEGVLAVTKLNEDAPPLQTGRTDMVAQQTEALVARLLERRLRDRYQNAEEVLTALEQIQRLRARGEEELPTAKNAMKRAALAQARKAAGSQPRVSTDLSPIPSPRAEHQVATPMTSVRMDKPSSGKRSNWLGLSLLVFLAAVGIVGGGLLGTSYGRGGVAYQWLQGDDSAATAKTTSASAGPIVTYFPETTSIASAPPKASAAPSDAGAAEQDAGATEGDAAFDGKDAKPKPKPKRKPKPKPKPKPEPTPSPLDELAPLPPDPPSPPPDKPTYTPDSP